MDMDGQIPEVGPPNKTTTRSSLTKKNNAQTTQLLSPHGNEKKLNSIASGYYS